MSRTMELFTPTTQAELDASQSHLVSDLQDALAERDTLNEHLLGRLVERDAHVDALMTRVSVLTVSLSNIQRALLAWADTYPDLGDVHDKHARGRFLGECAGCQAELRLLNLVDKVQEVLT